MPQTLTLTPTTTYLLRSNYRIPLLGYGTYQTPASTVSSLTHYALSIGYRQIDTAHAYKNESPTVAGVLSFLSPDLSDTFLHSDTLSRPDTYSHSDTLSQLDIRTQHRTGTHSNGDSKKRVKREDVFYTTKIPPRAQTYEAARTAIAESIARLSLAFDGRASGYSSTCTITGGIVSSSISTGASAGPDGTTEYKGKGEKESATKDENKSASGSKSKDESKSASESKKKDKINSLQYIDLLLLHSPFGSTQGRTNVWRAALDAVQTGHVRSLGVSNYGLHHLNELESYISQRENTHGKGAGGIISVVQVELHPFLQRKEIVSWCRERGIILQAWGPLVRGQRMDDERLVRAAKKHGVSPAQVLIRWSLQQGFVPLPKSVSLERTEENFDVFGFALDEEDMALLDTDEYYTSSWDPTVSPLEK